MKIEEKKQADSLEIRYKNYIEGKTKEEPRIFTKSTLLSEDGVFVAVLTKEIEDRDGEIVKVSGVDIADLKKGVPMLDSHKMYDNVTNNVLGRVVNIQKTRKDGIPMIKGRLEFAPTEQGMIAKKLVEGGFVDSVSIGFGVKEFDPQTRTITKSELYETSLVSVPANPEAKIEGKQSEEKVSKLAKTIDHYETIKPAWKEFSKTFLSDNFCKTVGYQKTGDLLIDINELGSLILNKLTAQVETPQAKVTPKSVQKELSQEQLNDLLNQIVVKILN